MLGSICLCLKGRSCRVYPKRSVLGVHLYSTGARARASCAMRLQKVPAHRVASRIFPKMRAARMYLKAERSMFFKVKVIGMCPKRVLPVCRIFKQLLQN